MAAKGPEELQAQFPVANALVLYVGGTIGMKGGTNGLQPVPQYLTKALYQIYYIHYIYEYILRIVFEVVLFLAGLGLRRPFPRHSSSSSRHLER